MMKQLSSNNEFNELIKSGRVIICDFYADWCGPCKNIAPIFANLSEKYDNKAIFLKINVDEFKETATKCGIKALPTFQFYAREKKIAEMQGADSNKLSEMVDDIIKKHSTFAGTGYSLSGNNNSNNNAATSISAQKQPPRRRNPWADESFVNKMLNKKKNNDNESKEEKVTNNSKSKPKPKVKKPSVNVSSSSEKKTVSTNIKRKASNQDPNFQTKPKEKVTTAAVNDKRIKVDQNLLNLLIEFGFGKVRSEKALIMTKNVNVEQAIEWLSAHENDADIDEPWTVVENDSTTTSVVKENSSKTNDIIVNDEEPQIIADAPTLADDLAEVDDDMKAIIEAKKKEKEAERRRAAKRAEKLGAKTVAEKPVEKKTSEMTSEEKMEWLEKKRLQARENRKKKDLELKKEREKSRQQTAKAALDLQRKREEIEAKAVIAAKKKKKKEDALARKRMREKVKAEKERRRKAREKDRLELERIRAEKANQK